MRFVSSETVVELIVASQFTHISHYTFPAWTNSGDANSAPFFKGVFVGVADHTNAAFLLLKADFIAGFDSQGSANLHRNSDLPLAGDLGAETLYRYGFCDSGHDGQLLTSLTILLTYPTSKRHGKPGTLNAGDGRAARSSRRSRWRRSGPARSGCKSA